MKLPHAMKSLSCRLNGAFKSSAAEMPHAIQPVHGQAMNTTPETPSPDPEWLNAAIPDWQHEKYVHLCLEWHKTKNDPYLTRGLPLQNRAGIEQETLLFVAIAMRDVDLLRDCGYDIRSAWIAIHWPEAIIPVRREVVWTLSEWARVEENRRSGIEDLFDTYNPVFALRRARMATRAAVSCAAADDAEAASTAQARADLYGSIADAKLLRDATAKNEARAWLQERA